MKILTLTFITFDAETSFVKRKLFTFMVPFLMHFRVREGLLYVASCAVQLWFLFRLLLQDRFRLEDALCLRRAHMLLRDNFLDRFKRLLILLHES